MAGMKGKVNMNDLKKFQSALKKMNDSQRRAWNEAAVKELAARLLAKVIKRTPKGKYPKSTGKKGGTLCRAWTVGEVKRVGDEYIIEVINPTEYAPYVEFGHRTPDHTGWVDGRFMLTISEQELQKDATKFLMNKMKTFMGGVFK
jgi:hypothetical protein